MVDDAGARPGRAACSVGRRTTPGGSLAGPPLEELSGRHAASAMETSQPGPDVPASPRSTPSAQTWIRQRSGSVHSSPGSGPSQQMPHTSSGRRSPACAWAWRPRLTILTRTSGRPSTRRYVPPMACTARWRTSWHSRATSAATTPLVDVHEIIDDTDDHWRRTLATQKRALKVEVGPGPVLARASAAAIRQILGVLLDNAVVHGAGLVTIRLRDAAGALAVDVIDEGDGITGPTPDLFARRSNRGRIPPRRLWDRPCVGTQPRRGGWRATDTSGHSADDLHPAPARTGCRAGRPTSHGRDRSG